MPYAIACSARSFFATVLPAAANLATLPSGVDFDDCPPVFDVRLWKDGRGDDNVAETIHRSKATGEPPLLLPFSVFFAIRDAVSALGRHRVDPPLAAPATPEAILRAIAAVRSPPSSP